MKIRVATWNINSIRIRLDMLKSVIKDNKIDVLLLQETKCQDCDFPSSAIQSMGMNYLFKGQKSYNGVAILSKYPIDLETDELPLYGFQEADEEARYVEAIVTVGEKILRVASVYVPMGGSVLLPNETLEESARFKYKLNFYRRVQARIEEIKAQTNNFQDEYVIFGGDFNVAQEEIDLTHPKANDGGVGFHPLERQSLRDIRAVGLDDAFRVRFPGVVQYTWWDYKTKGFDRNVGWRLDYLLSSKNVIDNISEIYVDMKTRAKPKTSDHAPTVVEVEI